MKHRHPRTLVWICVVGGACLGLIPSSAPAQNTAEGWPNKNYTVAKSVKVVYNGLGAALRTGHFADAEDETSFANFYNQQIFPKITDHKLRGTDEDVISTLRKHFKSNEKAPDTAVFNRLADLTIEYMTKIAADGQYHPAARVNAVIAMGEIKSAKTAEALVGVIKNRNVDMFVKVAAMSGLVRLAEAGVIANTSAAGPVSTLMVQAAGSTSGQSGIRWMRGQAADVLGALGSPGEDGKVTQALLKLLADPEAPLTQRGKAARALGKLKYGAAIPPADTYLPVLAAFGSDGLSPHLPADVRLARAVARDIREGLNMYKELPNVPSGVAEMLDAVTRLDKDCDVPKPTETGVKEAMAEAKARLDKLKGKTK